MRKLPLLFFLVFQITQLTSCSNTQPYQGEVLTLSYYPECDYLVLGEVSGKSGMSVSDYYQRQATMKTLRIKIEVGTKQDAILKLKDKAAQLGADAIAVTDFKHFQGKVKPPLGHSEIVEKYFYSAQAIKLCDDFPLAKLNRQNDHPVKYNGNGVMNIGINYKYEVAFPLQNDNEPQPASRISDTNILADDTILGFKFGQNRRELLTALGSPSAIITLDKAIQVYLYGRRHAFYFSNQQFVGYEYVDWFLPPHLSNQLDFHEQFDGLDWLLFGKVKLGALMTEVNEAALSKKPIVDANKMVLKQDDMVIELGFLNRLEQYDDGRIYQLNTISVYKKGFTPFSWKQIIDKNISHRTIDFDTGLAGIKLFDTKDKVIKQLGMPNAVIFKKQKKENWAYSENLMLEFVDDQLLHYSLEANIESAVVNHCTNCLYLGQNIARLPIEFIETEGEDFYLLQNNGTEYKVRLFKNEGQNLITKIETLRY